MLDPILLPALVVWWAARGATAEGGDFALWFAAAGLASCLGAVSYVGLALLPVLAATAVLLGRCTSLSAARRTAATLTVGVVGYGATVGSYYQYRYLPRAERFATLRERFPPEPLDDRLRPAPAWLPIADWKDQPHATQFEHEVGRQADRRSWVPRSLDQMHFTFARQFGREMGFGAVRGLRWNTDPPLDVIDIAPLPRLAQPSPVPIAWDEPVPSAAPPGVVEKVAGLHVGQGANFANPLGFTEVQPGGLDFTPGHVDEWSPPPTPGDPAPYLRGFQSHGFRDPPDEGLAGRWRLRRVELIGLLKYSRPQVYVTADLPRMEDTRDAPLRDPTPFESAALVRLGAGEWVVAAVDGRGGRLRAVGALPAVDSCVECHRAEAGTLLGALSYEWGRDGE